MMEVRVGSNDPLSSQSGQKLAISLKCSVPLNYFVMQLKIRRQKQSKKLGGEALTRPLLNF